ncbi:MAG: hypothetical protein KJ804_07080 [Proteobacteria bacterium]|nr:hypothetical protein [Pseudomonadota bacterium]MBU1058062.1 hypothetical protein [Pseudomonadota bacterium]
MNCCQKFFHRCSSRNRAVICLQWIAPLRILVIASLLCHLLYKILYPPPPFAGIITLIHIFLALLLLAECRRSVRYHNTVKEWEALEARKKTLL